MKEHGDIRASYEYICRLNLPDSAHILDIGCRYGSLIHKLYETGCHNVSGIDITQDIIASGMEKYPELAGRISSYDGDNIPFADNSLDIVLMFDVIEHIKDIDKFLSAQVRRVLKPRGRLIFQTPNKITNIPWEVISHRSLNEWKKFHPSLQTLKSLKRLLEKTGFKNIRIEKQNVMTEYNIKKVKKKLPIIGYPTLCLLNILPLSLSTNLWGHCEKSS